MNQSSTISDRQQDILQAIINTHITTAEAVGSRTVAKRMGYRLSPASIRNVMADLEEMGFVRQPHTSAGRIPTDTGYRLYVNRIMEKEEVGIEQRLWVEERYSSYARQIDDILELSTRLLSMLTQYTAVVQTPAMDVETIKHLEVVPFSSNKAVVIVVTNIGDVRKQVIVLPDEADESEIERLSRFLNEKLHSLSFAEAHRYLNSLDDLEGFSDDESVWVVIEAIDRVVAEGDAREVFLAGLENFFHQPEFQSIDRLRGVLKVLDEKRSLNELLEYCVQHDESSDICIRIGSENRIEDVRGCSIVASPYRVDGQTRGTIGVIGPTRMWYSRTSSLVVFVAERLGRVLSEMCGGD